VSCRWNRNFSDSLKSPALLLVCTCLASTSAVAQQTAASPSAQITIALVGDSTVADSSGWGPGFTQFLTGNARCVNLAAGGRSSKSFRTEGRWQKLLDLQPDYVLIQFGHNDQPGKGPERESPAATTFRTHLTRYVNEARQQGIKPVLLTSLTRRRWNAEGQITSSLAEYAQATTDVAQQTQTPLIDLHALSIRQCNAWGPEGFQLFEPVKDGKLDHTHLNSAGSVAVGQLVAEQLPIVVPDLKPFLMIPANSNPARPHPEAVANTHNPSEVDNPDLVPFIVRDPAQLPGIIVDDTAATLEGTWQYSTHTPPYVGLGYLHDQKSDKGRRSVTFTPSLPHAGLYEVRISHCYNVRRATTTPVTVTHADGATTVIINQQQVPEHAKLFRTIGRFRFEAGQGGSVRISNDGTDGRYVIADAVQFIPLADATTSNDGN
jgi:lysophospholipase L1-like esterase